MVFTNCESLKVFSSNVTETDELYKTIFSKLKGEERWRSRDKHNIKIWERIVRHCGRIAWKTSWWSAKINVKKHYQSVEIYQASMTYIFFFEKMFVSVASRGHKCKFINFFIQKTHWNKNSSLFLYLDFPNWTLYVCRPSYWSAGLWALSWFFSHLYQLPDFFHFSLSVHMWMANQ